MRFILGGDLSGLFNLGVEVLFGLAGRGLPGGNSLSFASPKESKQRKGDPAVCDSFASLRGILRYSLQAGSAQTRLRLKQRAALIRLKLRSSAQTEGAGKESACGSPYDSFSLWEKAGMRASGDRTPAGFYFKKESIRFLLTSEPSGSHSKSPHPNLFPEGEGAIRIPNPHLPHPVLAGPVLPEKNGIRAARCLSETQ